MLTRPHRNQLHSSFSSFSASSSSSFSSAGIAETTVSVTALAMVMAVNTAQGGAKAANTYPHTCKGSVTVCVVSVDDLGAAVGGLYADA